MTDSNPVCMDHNRFRKIRLIADHYCIADESDKATEIFDCIAWNKNLSANNCFVPGDVIALTGEYHKTGKRRKSISVTLQIQNIYIEGEKSANAYPTYFPTIGHQRRSRQINLIPRRQSQANLKKSKDISCMSAIRKKPGKHPIIFYNHSLTLKTQTKGSFQC